MATQKNARNRRPGVSIPSLWHNVKKTSIYRLKRACGRPGPYYGLTVRVAVAVLP